MHSFISISTLFALIFLIVANVNVAVAQDKPKNGNASNCAAQNILDACVKSTTSILNSCPVQDWECLCTQYTNVLTCYNNCPGDPGRFAVDSSKVANCNAAKHFGSSRSTSVPPATGTKATGTASAGDGSNASQTATGTGMRNSAAATNSPNAAAAMFVGGVELGIGGLAWVLAATIGYLV
ncbi:hypothetical protein AJ78_00157 [Emergomyces pasteurianus Ep9510]|uniref:GPI anchored serine-threonine rich protein n=1 Tax=Emergomyces pasteurianus Ep9510 TaxID=1447872 RepID=A0A1J9QID8_9EURO|nr:hypothetical protein AJ78_00157 [Emergomyces pasteurianus Ep9510]